jgi:hypothetical protein
LHSFELKPCLKSVHAVCRLQVAFKPLVPCRTWWIELEISSLVLASDSVESEILALRVARAIGLYKAQATSQQLIPIANEGAFIYLPWNFILDSIVCRWRLQMRESKLEIEDLLSINFVCYFAKKCI